MPIFLVSTSILYCTSSWSFRERRPLLEWQTLANWHRSLIQQRVRHLSVLLLTILLTHAISVAVYADGPDNFTTIGVVQPNPDNKYAQYIYTLYNERNIWNGTSAIVNDDDQFVLDDMDASWYRGVLSHVGEQLGDFVQDSWACYRFLPIVRRSNSLLKLCFPYEFNNHEPSKPRSRFRKLLSERGIRRLRAMTPKWFRSP